MSKTPVYLVDDDEGVRDALSLLLGTYGYAVRSFADPTSLLAASETLRPGCLLVDLRMPAISGLQLLERLGERGIDWPFIVITGHGDIHACRRAFKAGAVDFLTKPIDEQVLVEAVQAALARLDTQQEDAEARQLLATLTDREREVLEMVSRAGPPSRSPRRWRFRPAPSIRIAPTSPKSSAPARSPSSSASSPRAARR
jgi:FixJ family two-component response regulator